MSLPHAVASRGSPFGTNPELLHVRGSLRFRIGVSIFELFCCWQKEFCGSLRLPFWLVNLDDGLELSLRLMIWFMMMSRPLIRWYVERSRPRMDVRSGPGASKTNLTVSLKFSLASHSCLQLIKSSSPRMSLFIAKRISNERGVRSVGVVVVDDATVGLVGVAAACSI